ncbi:hypothetical protein VDGD_20272 [Verticillium dahliae]|nr:hypothetical protein VdG1_03308 [Verticillium dahliae VDG1]RBQ95429.1 hypothetical protein VDGD_20272 [Verticillium dahliae]
MSASAITIAAAPRPWSLKAVVHRFRSGVFHVGRQEAVPLMQETKYQAYVPTHARTDFLKTATPRHMRKANEIL